MHSVADSKKEPDVIGRPVSRTWRISESLFIVACVAVFSVYVAGTLKVTDYLLADHLAGYVYSGNYTIGMVIFFIASVAYLQVARWRCWVNWRYYILGSVAVFFPLVFLASSVKLLISPDGSLITVFNELYCEPEYQARICGQAFAALISSMSLRALPVVLSTPAMFWFIFIKSEYIFRPLR